jgi:glycogen operon protein
MLRSRRHPTGSIEDGGSVVSWHGTQVGRPDWSPGSRLLAMSRTGLDADGEPDHVYVATNAHWEWHDLELPELPSGLRWARFVDTTAEAPDDVAGVGAEQDLDDQRSIPVGPRSVVILVARPVAPSS